MELIDGRNIINGEPPFISSQKPYLEIQLPVPDDHNPNPQRNQHRKLYDIEH
jgi:hypothetical protein